MFRCVAYIAGPLTGDRKEYHISQARQMSIRLWRMGIPNICPHLNSRDFEEFAPYNVFIHGYLEVMRKCDFVILLSGWEESYGAKLERQTQLDEGRPLFEAKWDDWMNHVSMTYPWDDEKSIVEEIET